MRKRILALASIVIILAGAGIASAQCAGGCCGGFCFPFPMPFMQMQRAYSTCTACQQAKACEAVKEACEPVEQACEPVKEACEPVGEACEPAKEACAPAYKGGTCLTCPFGNCCGWRCANGACTQNACEPAKEACEPVEACAPVPACSPVKACDPVQEEPTPEPTPEPIPDPLPDGLLPEPPLAESTEEPVDPEKTIAETIAEGVTGETVADTVPDICADCEENEAVRCVNDYRIRAGLRPLVVELRQLPGCRAHCQAMASRGGIFHAGGWMECVASGYATGRPIVNMWLNSSGHRAIIMTPNASHIVIGHWGLFWTLRVW